MKGDKKCKSKKFILLIIIENTLIIIAEYEWRMTQVLLFGYTVVHSIDVLYTSKYYYHTKQMLWWLLLLSKKSS